MRTPKLYLGIFTLYRVFALAFLVSVVSTVGWVWCGWGYVAENRLLLNSLPVPPGAERTHVSSYGYSSDDSMITPSERWGTRAEFEFRDYTREDLHEFYISRLSTEWEYCRKTSFEGVWFVRGDAKVGLDTSNAQSGEGTGSFDIHVEHDYARNPCDK